MRRIRLADELAESGPRSIATLLSAWDTVCAHKFHDESPRAAAAWGQYLVALWYYHCGVAIRTITNHDEMLLRLSGPLLQLAPGMPEELWSAAAHFGALDQFWNNVRDMQEDAERGMCWLPESVLLDHGIRREDVMSGDAPRMSGWQGLMRWWLEARVARLEEAAASFIAARKPETLQLMQTWTLRRYARVACTFRAVEFDYRRFAEVYWGEVSQL
jgi:phytoene synthase